MYPFDFVTLLLGLSWGSPFGLGILLMGLGVYNWGRSFNKKKK